MPGPRKRGRPRKVRPGEAETPSTVVAPVAETCENPISTLAGEIEDAAPGPVGTPATVYVNASDFADMHVIRVAKAADPVGPSGPASLTAQEPFYMDAGTGAVFEDEGRAASEFNLPNLVDTAIADAMPDAAVAREHRPTRALTDLQRTAWATDVWGAYQAQDEIKRTDALNRVWTFRYEIVKNNTHMLVKARRGQQVSQQLILSSQMTMERALEAVDAADRETA